MGRPRTLKRIIADRFDSVHCTARLVLVAVIVLLTGCKEVLFSDLDELEANQMVAVLQAADVASTRRVNADGRYELLVEAAHIGASVLLLQNEGLPKQKFSTLGEIFADTGIVGTPFEERARFMHALNQELASTISAIDGVREARVHIVLPEQSRFDRAGKEASAAVAIYYRSDFEAQNIVPTVKTLMAHSVPELSYDDVAVSLFSASGAQLMISPQQSIGAVEASSGSMVRRGLTLQSSLTNPATLMSYAVLAAALVALATMLGKLRRHFARSSGAEAGGIVERDEYETGAKS